MRKSVVARLKYHWKTALILLVIGLPAVWLRIVHLGDYILWQDEAFTLLAAQIRGSDFLQLLRLVGVHPPLFFWLERPFAALFGANETGLRLLPAACGLASWILASWLGFKIAGMAGAAASAWFWAFHPMAIWYAQDARPYAMLLFLSLIAIIIFWKFGELKSLGIAFAVILALASGLLTHYFFFLTFAALIMLALAGIRISPHLFRRWTSLSLIAILPLAAWLGWFFMLPQPSLGIGWIQTPNLADLPLTIWNFLSGYAGRLGVFSNVFGLISGLLATVGIVWGKNASLNRRMLLFGVIVPLCATWLISMRRPVYMDRYFIGMLPFFIFPISSGAQALLAWLAERPKWRIVWIAALIAVGLWGLLNGLQVHNDPKYAREDWKGLVSQLSNSSALDLPVWLMDSESKLLFEYYHTSSYNLIASETPPACTPSCVWILRQPYTTTHAFTQAVGDPDRPWDPQMPPSCRESERWISPTGIGYSVVQCSGAGS